MNNLGSMNILVKAYRIESDIQKYKASGQIEKAIILYEQLIDIKQQLPSRLGLAKTIAERAYLLENCGFYNDALNDYYKISQITKNSPNLGFKKMIEDRIQNLQNI